MTGLTLGSDGQPVLVVAVCEGTYDAVEYARQVGGDTPSVDAGSASTATSHATDFTVGFGQQPGAGWTVDQPVGPSRSGEQYFVYAAVTGSRWTALPLDFTTRTLAGLRVGRVTWDRAVYESPAPATMVPDAAVLPTAADFSSAAEFHRAACALFAG